MAVQSAWKRCALSTLCVVLYACGTTHSEAPALPTSLELGLVVPDADSIVRPPGEELVANAELLGIHIGQLGVRLGPFCSSSGSDTGRIESRFDTAGVARWFRRASGRSWTTLDARTLFPRASHFQLENGDAWRNYMLTFAKDGYRFELDTSKGEHTAGTAPADRLNRFYDAHTAFLLLRSWKATPGERTYFYVVLGKDPWRVDVAYHGPSLIERGGKEISAVHMTGTGHRTNLKPGDRYTPREFEAWFSDDDERIPFRFVGDANFGSFRLELERREQNDPCFESFWTQATASVSH